MIKIQPIIYSTQNNNKQSFKAIQYTDMANIALSFEKSKLNNSRLTKIENKLRIFEESQKDNPINILLDFGRVKDSTEQHFFAIVNKKVCKAGYSLWGAEYIRVLKKAIKKAKPEL